MSNSLNYIIVVASIIFIFFIELSTVTAKGDDPNSACPIIEEEIIDLEMLTIALRETKAIGLIAKLQLKSDVSNILRRIDAWHSGNQKYSLDQLQEQYDLLLMKIAATLQDHDLNLHQKLCNAWGVIWSDLQDPQRVKVMRHGT